MSLNRNRGITMIEALVGVAILGLMTIAITRGVRPYLSVGEKIADSAEFERVRNFVRMNLDCTKTMENNDAACGTEVALYTSRTGAPPFLQLPVSGNYQRIGDIEVRGRCQGGAGALEKTFFVDARNKKNPDWISLFSSVPLRCKKFTGPVALEADIKANGSDGPVTVPPGTPVTISWTSAGATSCNVYPLGSTLKNHPGMSHTPPRWPTNYVIGCTNAAGDEKFDTVRVNPNQGVAMGSCPAGRITLGPPTPSAPNVSGQFFRDDNGNGTKEAAEPGASGGQLLAFFDVNNDCAIGVLETGGSPDASGNFAIPVTNSRSHYTAATYATGVTFMVNNTVAWYPVNTSIKYTWDWTTSGGLSVQIPVMPFNDYSDAPTSYGTAYCPGVHMVKKGPVAYVNYAGIGATNTPDSAAMPDDSASFDGGDDGVVFGTWPLRYGQANSVTINDNGQMGVKVSLWIDWNRNGGFENPGERVIHNQIVNLPASATNPGPRTFSVTAPSSAGPKGDFVTYARARASFGNSDNPTGLSGCTATLPGEVEDYRIEIKNP